MLYKSIFSVRGEPKARGGRFGPEFEPLFNYINGNLPQDLPRAVPAQGKDLLYRFVLSNRGILGLESRRVGWG